MNLALAIRRLASQGVPDAAGDARRLFDWAYGIGQEAPEPQTRERPNDLTLEMFEIALTARARRQPVSQILGRRAFWKHEFIVTPDVLDPRPETETLVEAALARPWRRVLDLGTGSGAILLSLLAARPAAAGTGVDISDAALAVARRNAAKLDVADRAALIRSDWFSAVTGTFDLILSNPPYIAAAEMGALMPEVRDHEPRIALTDEGDGLQAYRAITAGVGRHLAPGGALMVEIGPTQGAAVSALFSAGGLADVSVLPDLDGRDRVVVAHAEQKSA